MGRNNDVFDKLTTISSNKLELEDGSRIAVIGGGPAGSFFTYFALDFARHMDLNIQIDIIEPKTFSKAGPAGCNHCGGIVSESLVQNLSTEGIVLPTSVIRRGIESYTMHLEHGSTIIETPLREQRIASVYRGFGPKGAADENYESFDDYLLFLCKEKGAHVIVDRVKELERHEDGVLVKFAKSDDKKYDLVVGSVGLNLNALKLFKSINPSYIIPKTTKTHICELYMDTALIDEYFGNSMHVFLLNLPHIKFGALIPKGNYITLVLLGEQINSDIVDAFLNAEPVKKCFPKGTSIRELIKCQCFPAINIQGAKSAYGDRMILIGDSASSKLYKNGIGAAYITSKAAAKTVIFQGISEEDFRKHYQKICNQLENDNAIGKFVFNVTTYIQKSSILKKGLFNTVLEEQKLTRYQRRLSAILWDTFTGSASYKDILLRGLNPKLSASFLWNTLKGIIN